MATHKTKTTKSNEKTATTSETKTKPSAKEKQPTTNTVSTSEDLPKPIYNTTGQKTKIKLSNRLSSFLSGSSLSIGASCNVFSVGDDRNSISEAFRWAADVGFHQGAPSLDLSNLRPEGSKVSSGGTAGGLTILSPLDAICGYVRRELKKNGALIAYLDYSHPELDYFLNYDQDYLTKAVYVPGNHEDKKIPKEILTKLAQAYNAGKIFIVKRPQNGLDGEPLYCNLCTEIEIPHRGTCTLGVINLGAFQVQDILNGELTEAFLNLAADLHSGTLKSINAANQTNLFCNSKNNVQFGLGVTGLASFLGNAGISYEEFTEALEKVIYSTGSLSSALRKAQSLSSEDELYSLIYWLVHAYHTTTALYSDKVVKAFCIQPSATGAFQLQDTNGFTTSPEIQPVQGMRVQTTDGQTVRTLRKSTKEGDTLVDFSGNTATLDDVPYEVYRRLCCVWQTLMDYTGLAHRHSANFYGETFTEKDLQTFLDSAQKSLYYRLIPPTPGVDKTNSGVDATNLADFDVDSLLGGGSCSYDNPSCTTCAG